jgi:uncharacterized membrane protein (DUF441 family)
MNGKWWVPALVAAVGVVVFWLLAAGLRLLVDTSAIDSTTGIVAGVLLAVFLYRAAMRRAR